MGELVRTDNGLLVPPHRPKDALRLVEIGRQLGAALDAGGLPAGADLLFEYENSGPPSRLIDVLQAPKPLVVWCPTRGQLLAQRVRRFFRRFKL